MHDLSTLHRLGDALDPIIGLLALAAAAAVVTHAAAPAPVRAPLRLLRLADRLTALCVAAGALGMTADLIDLGTALTLGEPGLLLQSGSRDAAIVPLPLAWSLMCAVPLWLATMVYRQGIA